MKLPLEHRQPIRDPEVLERMRIAFDLYQTAEEMKRQRLRRRNPAATEQEIEEGIRAWLAERPGAEHGDGFGVPRATKTRPRLHLGGTGPMRRGRRSRTEGGGRGGLPAPLDDLRPRDRALEPVAGRFEALLKDAEGRLRDVALHGLEIAEGKLAAIPQIAEGAGIRQDSELEAAVVPGRWRRLKGVGLVRSADGTMARAEIHWYEAHGIGRKKMKIKRFLD